MKKTVALFAVAGLAAATSDFQDDYLALRLTKPLANATLSANRTNTTTPIKPIKPIALPRFPARNVTDKPHPRPQPRPHPRPELVKLMREAQKGRQNATVGVKPTQRPILRPRPTNNTANSTHTKPAQPKVKPTLLQNHDDEYFVDYDDEYYVDEAIEFDDDEYYMDEAMEFDDDALFAEDDFYLAKTNSTRPVKPIHGHIVGGKNVTSPHPLRTIGGKNVTSPYPLRPRATNSTNIPRPLPRRPVPKTNSTKSAAPLKPTRIPIKPIKPTSNILAADDEYFVDFDADEYWVDDEMYAEDDEFYAEDDEFYAEDADDFFAATKVAKNNATLTFANITHPVRPIRPIFKAYKSNNATIRPRPIHNTTIPRPHPGKPAPRPTGRPVHTTNSTKPVAPLKPTKPIKPTTNTTSNILAADDEYFVDFDADEYWVDDEMYAEDDEFYAEDDEYFMNADDDFYAARNRNQTETVKPHSHSHKHANSTIEHLKQILKDGKKEVKPAVHKIKETAKNVTSHVKDTIKNATKPAAPKKGFLSMF